MVLSIFYVPHTCLILLWQCSVHSEEDIRAKAIRLVRKLVPETNMVFISCCYSDSNLCFANACTGHKQTISPDMHIRAC